MESLLEKLKTFIKEKSLLVSSILAIIIIIMFATIIGTSGQKETLEKQYHELQAKSEETSQSLQTQIKEKDSKITDNEKKITELQQEEKINEINESIKTLESEKQKLEEEKSALEGEKQTLTTQIEELKKTSSILTERKNAKVSTSSNTNVTTTAQNTNSAIVYVTNTGKKYHQSSCSYLKKSKIQISLSEAQSQGYTACSKCY
ncbi:MAG: hypothetical protein HFJ35_02790 [Clostridia bacterium]|nr:hypothetical protein [Clostridia bacterium]